MAQNVEVLLANCRFSLSFELFALSSEFLDRGNACGQRLCVFWHAFSGHCPVAFFGEPIDFFAPWLDRFAAMVER